MSASGKITEIIDVVAVKKQSDGLIAQLDKILKKMEKVVAEVVKLNSEFKNAKGFAEFNEAQKKNTKATEETNEAVNEANRILKENEKLKAKIAQATSDEAKQNAKLKDELNNLNKSTKQQIADEKAAVGSITAKSQALAKLKESYRNLSEVERQSVSGKDMLKSIQDLDKEVKDLDKSIGNHQRNVGNYQSALEDLPGPIGQAISGFKSLAIQMWKLVTNPVGAIIAAIAANLMLLYKAFTSTDEGAGALEGIMKALGNVFDVVLKRVVSFYKSIYSLVTFDWAGFKKNSSDAFTNLGSSIASAAKAGWDYAQAMDALDDKTKTFVIEQAQLENQIARLRNIAKDRTKSDKERMEALRQAIDLEKQLSDKEVKHAKEKYDIEKENLAAKIGWFSKDQSLRKGLVEYMMKLNEDELDAERARGGAIARIYNENEAAVQELQAAKAESIKKDTEFFQGTLRMQSELSGLINEMEKDNSKKKEDREKEKQDAIKRTMEQEKEHFTKEKEFAIMSMDFFAGISNDQKASLETRLQALDDYTKKAQEANDDAMMVELAGVEENSLQYNEILKKYNLEAEKITRNSNAKRVEITTDAFEQQKSIALSAIEQENVEELTLLNQKYSAGLIGLDEYQRQREQLMETGAARTLETQIGLLEKELENFEGTADEKAQMEKDLAALRLSLSEKTTAAEIENDKKVAEKKSELFKEAFASIVSIVDSQFDRTAQGIRNEMQDLETAKARELELAGNNSEKKAEIEARYAARKKVLDDKEKANALQKAKFDKAAAMAKIIMDTAMAEMQLWVKPGFPAAIPLAAMVAAIGALQLATVAAQPLPKYRHGTMDAIGGPSIVGEVGAELIELPSGKQFITPSRATMVDLPRHTKVFTNDEFMSMAISSLVTRPIQAATTSNKDGWKEVTKAISRLENKQSQTVITEKGFRAQVRNGASFTEYVNKSVMQ